MTGGLEARGIHLALGGAAILAGVDLSLRPGELVGLIGPNGAGKSSLIRCLAGLLAPSRGTVTLDGAPLAAVPGRERGRRLAYLAQAAALHWPLAVERVVALGRLPHQDPFRRLGDGDAAAVERALEACDVAHLRGRTVNTLSGGERARVLLARALAGEPALLLADEPVAGLDPYHQLQVMEVLAAQAAAGTGVMMVLHDLTLAARFCGRLALLHRGVVAAEGAPGQVLRPAVLEPVYGVRMLELAGGEPVHVPWRRLDRGG